ncbi:EamA family transporter [Pantoea piersonii]|uniref:EamA family transporter n=1 Tax=Pantoea piersonii TaxID=2364647 RepID=UPI0028A2C486|nr:EamA family transporter [Pantoea piersonii]
MALKDFALAMVVIVAWGMNFVISKYSLEGLPPLLLGCVRFTLVVFPAIFFVRRPAISWPWLTAYGLTISMGQFGFAFEAIAHGLPVGLASVVLQAQAFFTLILASVIMKEKMSASGLSGLLVAGAGLFLISLQGSNAPPLTGLLLMLGSALCWAAGNLITRHFKGVNPVALVIWGALIPPVPFLLLSWFIEGPEAIQLSLEHLTVATVANVLYLSYVASLLGYGLWSYLLGRYPAGKIAPLSLLVPVVGIGSSVWLLEEHLSARQWTGCVLVMGGLVINLFAPRLGQGLKRRTGTVK